MQCALNKVEGYLEEGCVSIDDVVDKDDLQSALLTTFVWQPSFVCKHFPAVPLTVVCPSWGVDRESARETAVKTLFPWCPTHNKLAVRKKDEEANSAENDQVLSCGCKLSEVRLLKLIHPPFPGVDGGIVHPKLMLLRYGKKVRLVVGSANLHKEDWEEYGESVWWQDFPLRESAKDSEDQFAHELGLFLQKMGCEEELLQQHVYSADFSGINAHLITSVPGHFPLEGEGEENAYHYGHLRLRGLLETECKGWEWKDAPIDIQVSSVGGSGIHWYTNFTKSVAPETAEGEKQDKEWRRGGDDDEEDEEAEEESGESTKKGKRTNNLSLLRVSYPSQRHAASLSERMKQFQNTCAYWDSLRIVRSRLHQQPSPSFVVGQKPVLWHSKVMSRVLPPSADCKHRHGWLYLGSHNLSGAAWGNIAKDGNTMKMANYELGLLFISHPCGSSTKGVEDLQSAFKYLPYEPTYDGSARVPYEAMDRPHNGSASELGTVSYLITGVITKWKENLETPGRGFGFVRGTPEKAYADFMKKKELEKEQKEEQKGIYQPRRGRGGGAVDVFLREDVLSRCGFTGNLVEGTTVTLDAMEQTDRQDVQGWKATWVLAVDDSTAIRRTPSPAPPGLGRERDARQVTSPERRAPAPAAATPERGSAASSDRWERGKDRSSPAKAEAKPSDSDWTVVEKPKRRGNKEEETAESPSRSSQQGGGWSRGGRGGRGTAATPEKSDRPGAGREYQRTSPAGGRTWGDRDSPSKPQGSSGWGEGGRFNTAGDGWRSSPNKQQQQPQQQDSPAKRGGRGGGSSPWGTKN